MKLGEAVGRLSQSELEAVGKPGTTPISAWTPAPVAASIQLDHIDPAAIQLVEFPGRSQGRFVGMEPMG